MSELFEKHIELLEAVNNSETVDEHNYRHAVLIGFRDALLVIGVNQLCECDMFYIDKELPAEECRPMCAGVFLDWEPDK